MSTNKSKGTAWETALVKALSAFWRGRHNLEPRRVAQEGFKDSGDLHGMSPFIGQAKNWKSWEDAIREGLDGAEKQKVHADELYGVALVKRVRKSTGGGYAVMTVATWAQLLIRLKRAEAWLGEVAPDALDGHLHLAKNEAAEDFPKG